MKNLLLYTGVVLSLFACSSGNIVDMIPDNRPNYKTSRTTNPLEIPPDLTQSSIDDSLSVAELSATDNASLATYQNERNSQTAAVDRLEASLKNIQRSGDATWIEIAAKPDTAFKHAKRFWLDNGLPLSRVDANIGIMETDWLESEANLPASGISSLLARALSGLKDEGVRDKFRTRIDYDGTHSYIYLTHYGASEKQLDSSGNVIKNNQTKSNKDSSNNYAYFASSRNPELEVEMLRRLNLYLHKNNKQTATSTTSVHGNNPGNNTEKTVAFSSLSDGTPTLLIDANFNRAWMLLGVAIDRAGFDISEQNRPSGTYTFAKVTERRVGFIIKEVERDIETYQVGLADKGYQQIAVVRSYNGGKPTHEQAQSILQKISQKISF